MNDYTLSNILAVSAEKATRIFRQAKLQMPHLKVEHLLEDGPGHADLYEDAWSAVEYARNYIDSME